jgi:hypothetical protein
VSPAQAEPRAEVPPPAADQRPVTVILHTESSELTEESVRAAIGSELGVRAVAFDSRDSINARGILTIAYHPATRELAVTFDRPGQASVTRVVTAPARTEDILSTAALLAANLASDQSAELLPVPAAAPESVAAVALLPPPPIPVEPAPAPAAPPVERIANAALAYPLSANHDVPELHTHLSFNLLYGRIGQLDGVELGAVNTVSGTASGVQLGIVNVVGAEFYGVQASPLYNRSGPHEGLQLSLVNHANGPASGAQAGAVNVASGDGAGAAVGLVNVGGDFDGAQIGLVNVAGRVRGTQIGLLNVSDDLEGVPIGLVSVSRTGGVHPIAWASNTTYANTGVKFATRHTYSIFHGAAHYDSHADLGLFGAGLIFGASIAVAPRTFVDLDLGGSHLFGNTDCCQGKFTGAVPRQFDQSLAKVRAMIRGQLTKHLGFFAGLGVTGKVTYPLIGADTEVQFAFVPELLGGIQL